MGEAYGGREGIEAGSKRDDSTGAEHAGKAIIRYAYEDAAGSVEIPLRNDMLFHIVMQNNSEARRRLVASFLGIDAEKITVVHVENPIDFSTSAEGKEIILDLKATVDNVQIVNIEIQVAPYPKWTSRSVYYLCRMVEEQRPAREYSGLLPVTQISVMDFQLFADHREFFGRYRLLNEKDGYPYTNLLAICVLDLNAVDIASKEDRDHGLVTWARMFKASTWEEIQEICEDHPFMKEVAESMYEATTNEQTRDLLFRHEMWLRDREEEMNYAVKKGRDEGEAIGRAKGEAKGRAEGDAVRKEITNRLHDFIKKNPGKSAEEISKALGCSREDAQWGKDLFE